ncbi:MAG: PAS domain S-box protein [bacterium]|nr:PAS domain S-box protein [bacterium]
MTTISILLAADIQLTRIIDRSQNAVYAERVEAIWGTLKKSNNRLQKTELVEAYIEDFKESTLKVLRQTYYNRPNQPIYPFILDGDGKVVMHPVLPDDDLSLKQTEVVRKMPASEEGDFEHIYLGQKHWCIFKQFTEWNWVIGYTVPLDIKYRDARMFRNILVVVMGSITMLVLLALSLIIARITRPITRLTKISAEIAGGNLDQQIDPGGQDEVGTLARSFISMRDSIRQTILELKKENTERKRAEEEIRKLSTAVEQSPSVIAITGLKGRLEYVNPKFTELTGYSSEEAIGQNSRILKSGEQADEIYTELWDTISSDNVWRGEFHNKKKNGEFYWEAASISPIFDKQGKKTNYIKVAEDISEHKRTQEMLIQSEKMLSVGGLAAGMAHEINNPLAGMMQTADVMSRRLTDLKIPANQRAAEEAGTSMEAIHTFMDVRGIIKMLGNIRESGRRAAEIVQNMLSFARKNDSTFSTHNLADLLDQTVDLAGSDYDLKKKFDFRRIEIVREYEENLPDIPCESGKIQQVLLNILRNGAQAMQEETEQPGRTMPRFILRLAHEQETSQVRIEIEDNGPGMDEATRKRVFEPFFTTKPVGVGTGLGLSVSYFIITENHGGDMRVKSTPGEGTTFIISLPVERRR